MRASMKECNIDSDVFKAMKQLQDLLVEGLSVFDSINHKSAASALHETLPYVAY